MKNINVGICPHDLNPKILPDWIEFFIYLSKKTRAHFSPSICLDFECFCQLFPKIQFAYANPLDSLKLEREREFIPVAGDDKYDEVIFISRKGEKIKDISGEKLLQ